MHPPAGTGIGARPDTVGWPDSGLHPAKAVVWPGAGVRITARRTTKTGQKP